MIEKKKDIVCTLSPVWTNLIGALLLASSLALLPSLLLFQRISWLN